MAIDLTDIYRKYKGLWVALKADRVTVVASGESVHEARKKARDQGVDDPIFFKVPSQIVPQIGRV
jgi:hypothetical protein